MGFESRTQLSAFRLVCRRHPNLLASIFVVRSRSFLSGTLVCCWRLCNRTMRLKSWTVQTTGRKEWRSGYMDKLAGTNYMYTGTHICLLLIDHGTAQDSTVQHGDKDKDTKRSLARNKNTRILSRDSFESPSTSPHLLAHTLTHSAQIIDDQTSLDA